MNVMRKEKLIAVVFLITLTTGFISCDDGSSRTIDEQESAAKKPVLTEVIAQKAILEVLQIPLEATDQMRGATISESPEWNTELRIIGENEKYLQATVKYKIIGYHSTQETDVPIKFFFKLIEDKWVLYKTEGTDEYLDGLNPNPIRNWADKVYFVCK